MAAKCKTCTDQTGKCSTVLFYCPACKCVHPFDLDRWTFNGDVERPTFSPSLRVLNPTDTTTTCHLFVRDGRIEYCGDCPHEMAGKTVDMVDWDTDKVM